MFESFIESAPLEFAYFRFSVVFIGNPENDLPISSATDVSYFQLLPCEKLQIVLDFRVYFGRNTMMNPCRDDYPKELEDFLLNPMPASSLYNPINSPKLPYDLETCYRICAVKDEIQECGCSSVANRQVFGYFKGNITSCEDAGRLNCLAEIQQKFNGIQCGCYPKCQTNYYQIAGLNRIRFHAGRSGFFLLYTVSSKIFWQTETYLQAVFWSKYRLP